MAEGGNESNNAHFRAQANSFEEIAFAEPFAGTNPTLHESNTAEDRTVGSSGAEKISGNDYRSATGQNHGTGLISSNASTAETVDDSDGASVASNIPRSDPRPDVATFRRRQAQMLPICILRTLFLQFETDVKN